MRSGPGTVTISRRPGGTPHANAGRRACQPVTPSSVTLSLQMEHEVTAGRNYLDRVAKQASPVEASREAAMAGPEAGS